MLRWGRESVPLAVLGCVDVDSILEPRVIIGALGTGGVRVRSWAGVFCCIHFRRMFRVHVRAFARGSSVEFVSWMTI